MVGLAADARGLPPAAGANHDVKVLIAAMIHWGRQLGRVTVAVVMMELPFVLLTFFQAYSLFNDYRRILPRYQAQSAVAMKHGVSTKPHSRVVWLLFDELDTGVIDGGKPVRHRLPANRTPDARVRGRDQRDFAGFLHPPFTPRPISRAAKFPSSIRKVLSRASVTLASTGQSVPWDPQDNVFAQAISEGFTTGIVGWYIPYCRILKNSFNYCWWAPVYSNSIRTGTTIGDDLLTQLWNAADAMPFGATALSDIDRTSRCEHRITVYEQSLIHAKALASNLQFDLVYLHFPVPHPPGFYRADTHHFDCSGDYVDNVSLVDRTIGELRASMEAAGAWNNSTVIISSDHPYRTWLWGSINRREHGVIATSTQGLFAHVPLIVKLPRQHRGSALRAPIQHSGASRSGPGAAARRLCRSRSNWSNWLRENTSAQVAPVPIFGLSAV